MKSGSREAAPAAAPGAAGSTSPAAANGLISKCQQQGFVVMVITNAVQQPAGLQSPRVDERDGDTGQKGKENRNGSDGM